MENTIEKELQEYNNSVLVVNTKDDLARATACIKGIKGLQAKINDTFDPIVEKAHKAHKEAIAQRDKYLKPLLEVEKKFKSAIVTYTQRVEAEQREAERLANEALAKEAEAKKQELLSKSETSNEWDAEVLKEQAENIVPVTVDVQKKVVEQEGLSIRKTWRARVVDINQLPRAYLIVNQAMLNHDARNEETRKYGIPGVEFFEESSASVRT